jgi:hypothetical protein
MRARYCVPGSKERMKVVAGRHRPAPSRRRGWLAAKAGGPASRLWSLLRCVRGRGGLPILLQRTSHPIPFLTGSVCALQRTARGSRIPRSKHTQLSRLGLSGLCASPCLVYYMLLSFFFVFFYSFLSSDRQGTRSAHQSQTRKEAAP